jgi:hypothetical protein
MANLTPEKLRDLWAACREGERSIEALDALEGEIESRIGESPRSAEELRGESREGEKLHRAQMAEIVRTLAGPGPSAVVVDGVILAMADEDMVVAVPLDRVVELRPS